MGLDLKLLVVESFPAKGGKTWGYAHTILELERRSALFERIMNLQDNKVEYTPLPEHFTTYLATLRDGDKGYGRLTEDAYGNTIECLTAAELLTVADDPGVRDNHINRATWAYLGALPWKQPIALYWH